MNLAVGLKTDGVSMLVTLMNLFDVEGKDEILPCANSHEKELGLERVLASFFFINT